MENKIIGYHVTFKHLLNSIQKNGLIPSIPKDVVFDEHKAVFLFKTIDDAQNAIYNWLGERIEELEEELGRELSERLLTVDLTGLTLINTVEYEWACLDVIQPSRILKVEKI